MDSVKIKKMAMGMGVRLGDGCESVRDLRRLNGHGKTPHDDRPFISPIRLPGAAPLVTGGQHSQPGKPPPPGCIVIHFKHNFSPELVKYQRTPKGKNFPPMRENRVDPVVMHHKAEVFSMTQVCEEYIEAFAKSTSTRMPYTHTIMDLHDSDQLPT